MNDVKIIPLSELKDHPKNSELFRDNKDELEQLKKNIEKFGFKGAITINPDNVILAGHRRTKALKELGIKEVPCHVFEAENEEEELEFMIKNNLDMRHLSKAEQNKLAVELTRIEKEKASKRRAENLKGKQEEQIEKEDGGATAEIVSEKLKKHGVKISSSGVKRINTIEECAHSLIKELHNEDVISTHLAFKFTTKVHEDDHEKTCAKILSYLNENNMSMSQAAGNTTAKKYVKELLYHGIESDGIFPDKGKATSREIRIEKEKQKRGDDPIVGSVPISSNSVPKEELENKTFRTREDEHVVDVSKFILQHLRNSKDEILKVLDILENYEDEPQRYEAISYDSWMKISEIGIKEVNTMLAKAYNHRVGVGIKEANEK